MMMCFLPLPSFSVVSTDHISGSTQAHPAFDVKHFLKLPFPGFGEGTVLDDLASEAFNRLTFFQHLVDAFV